jgi:hypothetical protein
MKFWLESCSLRRLFIGIGGSPYDFDEFVFYFHPKSHPNGLLPQRWDLEFSKRRLENLKSHLCYGVYGILLPLFFL